MVMRVHYHVNALDTRSRTQSPIHRVNGVHWLLYHQRIGPS